MNNDIANVKKIFEAQAPIEFTAKALGLACRFCGPEMVETQISGGATFDFDLTPTLRREKLILEIIVPKRTVVPTQKILFSCLVWRKLKVFA